MTPCLTLPTVTSSNKHFRYLLQQLRRHEATIGDLRLHFNHSLKRLQIIKGKAKVYLWNWMNTVPNCVFLLNPSYVKTQCKAQINTIVHFISKAQLVSYSFLNYCIFYLKPRTKYSRDMTCSCPPPPTSTSSN